MELMSHYLENQDHLVPFNLPSTLSLANHIILLLWYTDWVKIIFCTSCQKHLLFNDLGEL